MSFNPFMHNVVKWPNILQKSCGAHTARFLKYVWPFYIIMHEKVYCYLFSKKIQMFCRVLDASLTTVRKKITIS